MFGKPSWWISPFFLEKVCYRTSIFCVDFRWAQVSKTTGPLSFSAIFLSFLGKSIKLLAILWSFYKIDWQFLQKFR